VRVSPKHDGGLLGAVQLAWDASHGVPLDFALYASGDSTPVLELKVTGISYGAVPLSDFAISPPSGANVVELSGARTAAASRATGRVSRRLRNLKRRERAAAQVNGVAAVAQHVKFTLAAPATLDGLPRRSASLLDWGGSPAALLLYGQNLGGVAVIERATGPGSSRAAGPGSSGAPSGAPGGPGGGMGIPLPSVSIGGVTGHELDTAIGTVVTFTRDGVSYVVAGSVPPVAAEDAARAL
jgi:hypothetical protein